MKPWSISAHNCFRRCQRQYLFRYIMASHNAIDPDRREAHMLRQLRSLAEWRGNLVHHGMEHYFVPGLEQRRLMPCNELTERTIALAQAQFRFSAQGEYKKAGITKVAAADSYLTLREHEYGLPVRQIDLDAVFEEIGQSYRFLYSQEEFLSFLQRGAWYRTEPSLRFQADGIPIIARLDLVMGYDNHKLCIVDWKIGDSRTSDYSHQLRLYAFAALQRWPHFQADDLLLVEANLLQGKLVEHAVDEEELLKMQDFIYRSVSEIRALAEDGHYDAQDLGTYEYANSPLSCEYCGFQRLCVRLSP